MQEPRNYHRIAQAITYIRDNFRQQPSLEQIAAHVHLSPFYLQRLFTEWAGVSPKKFQQFISINYAKQVLKGQHATLSDASYETGLSGTSRLHDLFVTIEGMTPGEYKNGGAWLDIHYHHHESPFGPLLVAATPKGVCYMAFDDDGMAWDNLQGRFPHARFHQAISPLLESALVIFTRDWVNLAEVKLHLKGTPFQLQVWKALLSIPSGSLATYATVAKQIDKPQASRAVGTAIGKNPVAYLIPCHRVIQAQGTFGNYMWGSARKAAIIGWEAAQLSQKQVG